MEWIAALAVVVLAFILLPPAIVAAKRSLHKNGKAAGAVMVVGLVFGSIFDPARTTAIENIQKDNERGEDDRKYSELLE